MGCDCIKLLRPLGPKLRHGYPHFSYFGQYITGLCYGDLGLLHFCSPESTQVLKVQVIQMANLLVEDSFSSVRLRETAQ